MEVQVFKLWGNLTSKQILDGKNGKKKKEKEEKEEKEEKGYQGFPWDWSAPGSRRTDFMVWMRL